MRRVIFYVLFWAMLMSIFLSCQSRKDSIFGRWKLNSEESSDIVTWRYRQLEMTIRENGEKIEIVKRWKSRRAGDWVDSLAFVPNGDTIRIPIKSAHWSENWYMGVLSIPGTVKKVSGYWDKPKKELIVNSGQLVQVSQGRRVVSYHRKYALSQSGDKLTVIEKRSSRPSEILLTFDRIQN